MLAVYFLCHSGGLTSALASPFVLPSQNTVDRVIHEREAWLRTAREAVTRPQQTPSGEGSLLSWGTRQHEAGMGTDTVPGQ